MVLTFASTGNSDQINALNQLCVTRDQSLGAAVGVTMHGALSSLALDFLAVRSTCPTARAEESAMLINSALIALSPAIRRLLLHSTPPFGLTPPLPQHLEEQAASSPRYTGGPITTASLKALASVRFPYFTSPVLSLTPSPISYSKAASPSATPTSVSLSSSIYKPKEPMACRSSCSLACRNWRGGAVRSVVLVEVRVKGGRGAC